MTELTDVIHQLCSLADDTLWAAHAGGPAGGGGTCRLRFPEYRDGRRRISEQEARFAFVGGFSGSSVSLPDGFTFAVENPTYAEYTFTGAGRSAATDLSVYGPMSGARPVANIEFKSGGFSELRSDDSSIRKDLAKLLIERVDAAVWFHLFERTSSLTLSRIVGTLQATFNDLVSAGGLNDLVLRDRNTQLRPSVFPKQLVVHLCVLDPPVSFERKLLLGSRGPQPALSFPRASATELVMIDDPPRSWERHIV